MKVSNGIYKQVKINWGSVTLPLKEGSPISLAGVVANNGNAIGLVPQTYDAEPLMKTIYVLAGGDVDLAEVNTLSGLTLSSAAKANMSGIRFWKSDGTVDDSADASLPSVTAEDDGDVLTVVSGAWAKATPSAGVEWVTVTKGELADGEETVYVCTTDKTFAELSEAYESGKLLVCKYTDGGNDGYTAIPLTYVSINTETHNSSMFHFEHSVVEPDDSGISCVYIYATIDTIGAGVDLRNAQYTIERD